MIIFQKKLFKNALFACPPYSFVNMHFFVTCNGCVFGHNHAAGVRGCTKTGFGGGLLGGQRAATPAVHQHCFFLGGDGSIYLYLSVFIYVFIYLSYNAF